MYCELFTYVDSNTLVLCPNRRLATHLQFSYNHLQQQKNLPVWPSATIMPLSSWLSEQWQKNLTAQKTLLSDFEENLLWQEIISNNPGTDLLLQISNTAQLAKQAWQTLILWQTELVTTQSSITDPLQILSSNSQHITNPDILQFTQWAQSFEQIKQQRQLISSAELPATVQKLLQQNHLHCPQKIFFVGFDDLSPAIQQLFAELRHHSECIAFEPKIKTLSLHRQELRDQAHEIIAMAHWAQQLHQRQPQHQIGCIIPNLTHIRAQVVRIFSEIFCPDHCVPGQKAQQPPYNISAGTPFHQLLMIKTALHVLRAKQLLFQPELIASIFLSPYINNHLDDQCLAAMIANQVHQCSNLQQVLAYLAQETQHHFPKASLLKRWQQAMEIIPQQATQSCVAWAENFQKTLKAIGWPGQRALSSEEYQILQRWQQVLLEFAKLNQLFPSLSEEKALTILQELCQQTLFQAQSQDTPIQVLGLLEASGCEFDSIWIMGLDDEAWPPKAEPNPFIPIVLQRQHAMPHASAQRELHYCQVMQHRLISSAQTIIVSSSKQEGDKTRLPSPLIKSIPLLENNIIPTPLLNHAPLELIHDTIGPTIDEKEKIQGGSWILQQQALCPFRAFATVRLKAKSLPAPEIGLSATQRGTLTHQALELLWKALKSQRYLLQLSHEQLQTLIAQSVEQAIQCNEFSQNHYLIIERQRLQTLLSSWLAIEKQRPPFTVLKSETTRHIKIGPLKMRIQIDRIDELASGQHLIIDYKTGKYNSIHDWFGERLSQPQLPIYSLYGSENTVGLAYAEVNLLKLQFKGIIDSHESFSAIQPVEKIFNSLLSWQQLQQRWKQALEELSKEFCHGIAKVDPQPQACEFCDLHAFCRIGDS